eukprot:4672695-Prymnesium_polylepis.1
MAASLAGRSRRATRRPQRAARAGAHTSVWRTPRPGDSNVTVECERRRCCVTGRRCRVPRQSGRDSEKDEVDPCALAAAVSLFLSGSLETRVWSRSLCAVSRVFCALARRTRPSSPSAGGGTALRTCISEARFVTSGGRTFQGERPGRCAARLYGITVHGRWPMLSPKA